MAYSSSFSSTCKYMRDFSTLGIQVLTDFNAWHVSTPHWQIEIPEEEEEEEEAAAKAGAKEGAREKAEKNKDDTLPGKEKAEITKGETSTEPN